MVGSLGRSYASSSELRHALAAAEHYPKAYRYAHDEPEGYAAGENYFPENMPAHDYYQPVARGLEIKIAEKLAHLRQLDKKHKPA